MYFGPKHSPKSTVSDPKIVVPISMWMGPKALRLYHLDPLHHPSLTVRPWKMAGWKTILSYWEGNFSGASCNSTYILKSNSSKSPTPGQQTCQTNHPKNCKHRASRVRFGSDYHSNLKRWVEIFVPKDSCWSMLCRKKTVHLFFHYNLVVAKGINGWTAWVWAPSIHPKQKKLPYLKTTIALSKGNSSSNHPFSGWNC